ncbi:hypothetical protein [Bacteroides sp.]|uniref:hypothetical protein n=1 Tax=Bacteroides sp. TaxID=29523 RepID=UPI00262CB8A2|nr:hypothetical protein [Bacteroides sp.]MDD3038840.1 hypothetical protein [Bacteroides sp.]
MKTISIDVKATNVEVRPNMTFVNLIADVSENEIDSILDSIDKDVIAEYMSSNGYVCEKE